jgi:hypothetical protein
MSYEHVRLFASLPTCIWAQLVGRWYPGQVEEGIDHFAKFSYWPLNGVICDIFQFGGS